MSLPSSGIVEAMRRAVSQPRSQGLPGRAGTMEETQILSETSKEAKREVRIH